MFSSKKISKVALILAGHHVMPSLGDHIDIVTPTTISVPQSNTYTSLPYSQYEVNNYPTYTYTSTSNLPTTQQQLTSQQTIIPRTNYQNYYSYPASVVSSGHRNHFDFTLTCLCPHLHFVQFLLKIP